MIVIIEAGLLVLLLLVRVRVGRLLRSKGEEGPLRSEALMPARRRSTIVSNMHTNAGVAAARGVHGRVRRRAATVGGANAVSVCNG